MTDPLQGAIIFLHGFNKVGKTNLAYGFPQPMRFLATERGHKWAPESVKKRMISLKPDTGWADFQKAITKLKTSKAKTVVVDTIDNLYRWAVHSVMEKKHGPNGPKHPGDIEDFGASWDACRVGFNRVFSKLGGVCEDIGATLLIVSHSTYRTIDGLDSKYDKVMTSLPGQAQDILLAEPDEIWHMGFGADPEERILYLMGREAIQCGSRSPHLMKKQLSLPRDPVKAYRMIAKAYMHKEQ
tara:strand:- start:22553 stop:23275 length:723 start_codon:yes stop_codon:yes gene_type:complete